MDDRVNAEIADTHTDRKPEEWAPVSQSPFNIAPTEDIPILLDSAKTGELRFERAHCSLVSAWSPTLKLKFPNSNARAEGMAEKSTWRKPLHAHRAIVLARGFYEWTGEKGSKTPWHIPNPDGVLLGFASLYSWWPDPNMETGEPNRWTLTATVMTSDSVKTLAGIHDRNPAILPKDLWLHWITPTITSDQALVDEAARAGATEAEQLRIDHVCPFGARDKGAHPIEPVSAP